MSGHFKYIVVGRGMMGAAAARHLAEKVDGVALIGPVSLPISRRIRVFLPAITMKRVLPAPSTAMPIGPCSPIARLHATPI